jgi:4-hydroxybenzoate polyprenyltransferase
MTPQAQEREVQQGARERDVQLGARADLFPDLIATLRPVQWVKNGFVFMALVFSLHLDDADAVARTLAAFVVFCLASSSAYVWNDVLDAERDAVHADKRSRPVACGRVPRPSALVLAAGLAAASFAGAALLGPAMLACVAAFLALQAAYSLLLKHVPVIDAVSIAAGFVLRTLAGVLAAGARMSAWLFLATFLLALFLALAKRRAEIASLGDAAALHRPALDLYRRVPLDLVIALVATGVIALYTQYTLSAEVAQRLGTGHLYVTVPFVVCGVFRYLFLIYGRDEGGNPTESLLGDGPLLATVGLWAAVAVALIYS